MPHADYDAIENLHSMINDHFDPSEGRFLSDHEVQDRADKAADDAQAAAAKKKRFTVPAHLVDDWTGQKWAENIYSFGRESVPPENVKTKEDHEAEIKEYQERLKKYEEKF